MGFCCCMRESECKATLGSWTLIMEAVLSSEMSVAIYQSMRHNIPGDSDVEHRREPQILC